MKAVPGIVKAFLVYFERRACRLATFSLLASSEAEAKPAEEPADAGGLIH